jgi:hypothetical protein
MLEKLEFSAEKVLKHHFFQEIQRNFPRKITFCGKKMYEKSASACPERYSKMATGRRLVTGLKK